MIPCVSSRSSSSVVIGCILALSWMAGAWAQEPGEAFQVHGFFSQAVARSDHNDVGGKSSQRLAWDLRELGGNVSWRPDPDWIFSAQALMRWAGKADEGDLRLDYGFVDRTLLSGDDRLGVQLGKIKNPYGFYNTTRDVAHTRPGILMPQSIYWDRIRDFVLAAPGVSLYGEHDRTSHRLSWQASYLRPIVDNPEVEHVTLMADRPGRLQGRPSWLAQVMLEMDDDRWRLGLSLGEMATRYAPAVGDVLQSGKNLFRPVVLSLEHNREHWSFTAEYAETDVRSRGYGPFFQNPDNTVQAYYVQATWRFQPRWQAYVRHDTLYINKSDRKGRQFEIHTGLPGALLYAEDNTLGLRFDPDRHWALSMEVHRVAGMAWLTRQDNPGVPKKDWTLLLLQAAYRF